MKLAQLAPSGETLPLDVAWAMMLPVQPGLMPLVEFLLDVSAPTTLRAELRVSSKVDNHTPDVTLETQTIPLRQGAGQSVRVAFAHTFSDRRYAFVCFFGSDKIRLRASEQRMTGVLSLCQQVNLAVAESSVQSPPPDSGIDSFEFWLPQRRPNGRNLALRLEAPLRVFGVGNLVNGIARPTNQPNAWIADWADPQPTATIRWAQPQSIQRIELMFDVDYDHPLESVMMGHPERRMPFCVAQFRVLDERGTVLAESADNHQARAVLRLSQPVTTLTSAGDVTVMPKVLSAAERFRPLSAAEQAALVATADKYHSPFVGSWA